MAFHAVTCAFPLDKLQQDVQVQCRELIQWQLDVPQVGGWPQSPQGEGPHTFGRAVAAGFPHTQAFCWGCVPAAYVFQESKLETSVVLCQGMVPILTAPTPVQLPGIVHLGRQQNMAQVGGALPCTWKTCMECRLASPACYSHLGGDPEEAKVLPLPPPMQSSLSSAFQVN